MQPTPGGRDDISPARGPDDARFLEQLIASSPTVILAGTMDADQVFSVTYVSPNVQRVFGYEPDEILGLPDFWQSHIHADDRRHVREQSLEAAARRLERFERLYRFQHRDGSHRWVHSTQVATYDPAGQEVSFVGHLLDVTERKQASDALREAEERYRTLVEQLPAAIYVEDITSATIFVSAQIEALTGFAPHEWPRTQASVLEMIHPDDRETLRREIARTDATSEMFDIEYRIIHRDGRVVWVHNTALLVRDAAGQPRHWHGLLLDITERKRAEAEAHAAEERYRLLVEQMPAVAYSQAYDTSEPKGIKLYISPQIEALTGYSQEEWGASDPWKQVIHPDDRERVLAEDARTNATGEPFDLEYRMIARDGSVVWVRDRAIAVHGEDGEPLLWQGVFIDQTERRLAEEARRASESRFRAALDASLDSFHILEAVRDATGEIVDFTVVEANHRIEELWHMPVDDVIGRNVSELFPHYVENGYFAIAAETLTTGVPFASEVLDQTPGYPESWLQMQIVRLGDGVAVTARDVTAEKQARTELARLEQRMRLILDTAAEGIIGVGRDSRTMFVNPAASRMLGYSAEELLGTIQHHLIHHHYPDGSPYPLEACPLYAALRDGVVHHSDADVFWRKDGTSFPVEYWSKPVLRDGVIEGAVFSFIDITERKIAEQTLAGQHRVLTLLATGEPLGVVLDELCRSIEEQLPGALISVLLCDPAQSCLRHGGAPSLPEPFNQAMDGAPIGPDSGSCGAAAETGQVVIASDIRRDRHWANAPELREQALRAGIRAAWSTPIAGPPGADPIGVFGVYHHEATEPGEWEFNVIREASALAGIVIQRSQTQRKLEQAEERYRLLVEQVPVVVYQSAPAVGSVNNYISPRIERLLGYTPDEWGADPLFWTTRVHPGDRQRLADEEAGSLAERRPFRLEYRYLARDDRVVWVLDEAELVAGEDGRPLHWQGVMTDITERKEAQEALLRSQAHLRLALRAGEIATWEWDIATGVAVWSENFAGLFRLPADAFDGTFDGYLALVHPDERARLATEIEQTLDRNGPFLTEHRLVTPSGLVQWIEGRGTVVRNPDGQPVAMIGTARNVSERKEADEIMVRQQRYVELLRLVAVESNQATTVRAALATTLDALCRALAWPVGRVYWVDGHEIRPSDLTRLSDERFAPLRALTEATTVGWGEGLVGRAAASLEPSLVRDISAVPGVTRAPGDSEVAVHGALAFPVVVEGRPVAVVECLTGEVADPDPFLLSIVAQIADVLGQSIERLNSQQTLTQTKLDADLAREDAERANRAKSEFLSRMSHELRTPLNAILGFGQVLEIDATTEQQLESVQFILTAGQHLLELVNEVLDISRIDAGRISLSIEPVRAFDVVGEALALVAPLAAERRIRIDVEQDAGYHLVADQQRLKQVLLNLLANAIKYNHEGGDVRVGFALTEGRVRIAVSDTGPGIAPEDQPKVFEPFERLAAAQTEVEGSGLGLSLSLRLVELMGGEIGLDSAPGAGSTFWVRFAAALPPLDALEAELPSSAPALAASDARWATILYVEDNLSNLKLIERLVSYRPNVRLLVAMQGQMGIDLARQHQPDLVLLDLNLPDLHGRDVLETLRGDPATAAIPVIVLSADATQPQIDRLLAGGAQAYLTKPVRVAEFFATVDAVLGEPS